MADAGLTGGSFYKWQPGKSPNPGGRPRGVSEFRERCREKTTEIVEVMEHVFFKGTWPPRTKQKPREVSDAVRMSAGIMLVSHGWGTAPNSVDVKISLPPTDIKQIRPEMSTQEAMDIYARTVANDAPRQIEGPDAPATIEGECVDITESDREGES
jgi:hypothetical protein